MAELRRRPGRGAVAVVARHARLRMPGRLSLRRLAVVTGLALAWQYACVTERRWIAWDHGCTQTGTRQEMLVYRIQCATHHRANARESPAELRIDLGMASNAVLTRLAALVADALGHEVSYTEPRICRGTAFMASNTKGGAKGDVRRSVSLHVHAGKRGEYGCRVAFFTGNSGGGHMGGGGRRGW